MEMKHYGLWKGVLLAGSCAYLLALSSCIRVSDITGQSDNPALKGNAYCSSGAEFVVEVPLRISSYRARSGGYSLYEVSLPGEADAAGYGQAPAMMARGYLQVGDTVKVDRVVWVRHFDTGDHVEIRATVINGRYKGMPVDLRNVQEARLLKPISLPEAAKP